MHCAIGLKVIIHTYQCLAGQGSSPNGAAFETPVVPPHGYNQRLSDASRPSARKDHTHTLKQNQDAFISAPASVCFAFVRADLYTSCMGYKQQTTALKFIKANLVLRQTTLETLFIKM